MSRQHSPGEPGRRTARPSADADHPADEPARPGGPGDDLRRDRLDTIEWADDRTRALDHHAGMDEAPIEDLMDGGETDASYRAQARRATPTLDPESGSEDDGA